jgi:hypothetical protein
MANGVFNIAKGKVNEYVARVDANDPANSALILVLLKVAAAEATLKDQDTLAAILAGGSTEADFTGYVRKTITDADLVTPTPDDGADTQSADITADPVWTAAGGASNNTLVRMLVCYDSDTTAGTDANIVPLCYYDFATTTNGGDLTAQLAAAGFFTAG